jgi:cycloeucalenol cycloisomerase
MQRSCLTRLAAFRVNVWVAILSFVGNHFITHYFYTILGMRYTVPVGPWSLNGVPLVMFLMTHPVRVCERACVPACLRVCVHACVCACMRA